MEEDKQIINQLNIEETGVIQKIDSLSIKGELEELMPIYIQDRLSEGESIYKDVKEYVFLAKDSYELHIMFSENEKINTLKKEYDKIMTSINDINSHLQQKEEKINELEKELEKTKKKLAESQKRKEYYEKSYKKACEENDRVKNKSSKLNIELISLKKKTEVEQIKNKRNILQNTEASEIDINIINKKMEELLLKMGSINEEILYISENTSHIIEKGINGLLSRITIQLREELLNSNQSIINKEYKPAETNNDENTYYDEESINDIQIGKQDFNGGDFGYIENISNADLDLEPKEENQEELEDIKNIIMEENDNENNLPNDREITNAKELLQMGIQSREINKTIKNIEESSPFFLRFKKKMDINKKVKLFNKEKDDVKKRQMILEEAMANNFDKNIIRGLKELSGMDTVSLEFVYQMACDKNTSIEDIMKLNEYVTA